MQKQNKSKKDKKDGRKEDEVVIEDVIEDEDFLEDEDEVEEGSGELRVFYTHSHSYLLLSFDSRYDFLKIKVQRLKGQ